MKTSTAPFIQEPGLPRVLVLPTGEIDTATVREILSLQSSPAKKIRALFVDVKKERMPSRIDVIQRLAEELQFPKFRNEWSRQAESRRPALPPIGHLALDWAIHNSEPKVSHPLKIEGLFTKRKKVMSARPQELHFPRLENINLLLATVAPLAKENIKIAAIYCWGLIEKIEASAVQQPTEPSLRNFRNTLISALTNSGLTALIEQLETAAPIQGQTTISTSTIEPPTKQDEQKHPEQDGQQRELQFAIPFARTYCTEIEDARKGYKRNLTRASSSLNSGTPDLDAIISLLKEAQICELKARERKKEYLSELANLLNVSLTRFDATVDAGALAASELDEVTLAEEIEAILKLLIPIPAQSDPLHTQTAGTKTALSSIDSTRLFVEDVARRAKALEAGKEAEKTLYQLAVENFSDLSWNTFSENSRHLPDWERLVDLQAARGQLNILGALAFRAIEAPPSNSIVSTILQHWNNPNESLKAIEFLGHLTLGQVERLALDHSALEEAAMIAQFEAFTGLMRPAESFDIWSVFPINKTTARPLGDPFNDFFCYSYALFSHDVTYPPQRLKLIARIGLLSASLDSFQKPNSIKEALKPNGSTGAIAKLIATSNSRYFAEVSRAGEDLNRLDEAIRKLPALTDQVVRSLQLDREEQLRGDHLSKVKDSLKSSKLKLKAWLHSGKLEEEKCKAGHISDAERLVIQAVKQMSASGPSRERIHFLWIKAFSEEIEPRNSIWSLNRNRTTGWDSPASFHGDPKLPRSYVCWSKGDALDCGILATDLLLQEFRLLKTVDLANLYVEQGFLEAYQTLSTVASEEIPFDLDRELGHRIEQHARSQNERLKELGGQYERLWPNETTLELDHCRDLLNSERWSKAHEALAKLAQRIDKETARQLEEADVMGLRKEIQDYAGHFEDNETLSDLRKKREALVRATEARRTHLLYVSRLAEINVNADVTHQAHAALLHLRRNSELPKAENAEYVTLLFGEAFNPLAEQLRRSKNFMPLYAARLAEITSILLDALLAPSSVADPTSRFLLMLERLCSKFLAIAEADINAIEVLLEDIQKQLGLTIRQETLLPKPAEDVILPTADDVGQRANEMVVECRKRIDDFLVKTRVEVSASEDQILANYVSDLRQKIEISLDDHALVLALATDREQSSVVRNLLPTRNSKGFAWDLVSRFLVRLARVDSGLEHDKSLAESIQLLAARPGSARQAHDLTRVAFGLVSHSQPGPMKWVWDGLSGDPKQAEIRAELMGFLAQCGLSRALSYCLTAAPVEFNERKADALALAAVSVYRENNGQIARTFAELRRAPGSRVFSLFAEQISSLPLSNSSQTSTVSIVGDLQRLNGSNAIYQASLKVVPNTSDWPQSIEIKFPPISPVRAGDGSRVLKIEGPFVSETNVTTALRIEDANASNFTTAAECHATSISGVRTAFGCDFVISISGAAPFEAATPTAITNAFDNFPSHQMRGDSYVPRVEDEQRIEKALILSNAVRSIWISSPRRSGKTTMLYRILDSYSHKASRDIAICYFTIDTTFSSAAEFNAWIWKKMVTSEANRELRQLYPDFAALGRDLPFDADCGTFFAALSENLLSSASIAINRAIFLIDEIDRFASMHLEGGDKREAARDIIWQLRNMIGLRNNIGFIFAGSSAAKRIFVTDPESPFFNSISLLDLIPFSTKTKSEEGYSRMIVEPTILRSRYHFPRETLEHLIWICSGIPYYMKLLAGATMAVAKQRYLLRSDVNTGLQALLSKKTGIEELDELGGDPGADELRTMALEIDIDKTLTRAVLYAVAEMQSPVSGQRLLRGRLLAADSPLVMRYRLSRENINRGLKISIDLGLLTLTSDEYPQVYFSIPLLGESLRASKGRNWAAIDQSLIQLEGNP